LSFKSHLPNLGKVLLLSGVLYSIWPWLPVGLRYDVTEIGEPGMRYLKASHMNDRGDVVGEYQDGSNAQVLFVHSAGIFKTLEAPTHPDGTLHVHAKAINNRGVVLGSFQVGTRGGPESLVLFLHRDGKTQTDPRWPRGFLAVDINDAGHVLADGTTKTPCEVFDFANSLPPPAPIATKMDMCPTPAYLIARGDAVELRHGKDYNRPTAMNARGDMAFRGAGSRGHNDEHAINAQGVVVGQHATNDGFVAFSRAPGETAKNLPVGGESSARSINDVGDIIGSGYGFLGEPFLLQNGKVYNLKRLARLGWWSWGEIEPLKINNRGQILFNWHSGGVYKAMLLTPRATP
jgi:hypothetical protein